MPKTKTYAEPEEEHTPSPATERRPAETVEEVTPVTSARARREDLPPPNAVPSVERAAGLVRDEGVRPGAPSKARLAGAMQRAVGNGRLGRMLGEAGGAEMPAPGEPGGAPEVPDTGEPVGTAEVPDAAEPAATAAPVVASARHGIEVPVREERAVTPSEETAEETAVERTAPAPPAARPTPATVPEREAAAAETLEAPTLETPSAPAAVPEPAAREGERGAGAPAAGDGAAPGAAARPGQEAAGASAARETEAAATEAAGGAVGGPAAAEVGATAGGAAAAPEGAPTGAVAVPGGAAGGPDVEGGGDEEAAADEVEDRLEEAAPAAEEADEEEAPEPAGVEPPSPSPTAPAEAAEAAPSPATPPDLAATEASEPAAETPASGEAFPEVGLEPEATGPADTTPDLAGPEEPGGEIDDAAAESEQVELSPAERDAAMGAVAEPGGSAEPSGGGGGGGAAIPEETSPPTPEVADLDPAAALAAAASAPPAQLAGALGGVKAAVGKKVGEERTELAENPPTVERPAGRGSEGARGEEPGAGRTPKQVEKAPAGREERVPPPEPLPAPPRPVTETVHEPAVASTPEGELTEDDARRIQGSLGAMPTSDPGLQTDAGPRPRVPLEGNADPNRIDEQRTKLRAGIDQAAAEGRAEAAADMGEHDIYDDQPAQTLRGEAGAAAGGGEPAGTPAAGAGTAAGGDGEAASIIAQEEKGDEIASAVATARADMAAKRERHAGKVAEEKAKSREEIAELEKANAAEKERVREGANAEVRKRRGEWTDEEQKAVRDATTQGDSQVEAGREEVRKEKSRADEQAAEHLREGEAEARRERAKAEREAVRKKREAKEESSGLFGWLASKAKAFFNRIKQAIKATFEAARRLVRAAIEKAKQLAARAIELARKTIVAAIKKVGDALIAIGDRLLAHLPGLRDRFRKLIRGAVDRAVSAVNELAKRLNAAIQRALDVLGAALDAALGLLEKGLLAAVDAVGSVVEGALKFANSVVQALAAFAALVKDVASGPIQWLKNLGAAVVDGIRNHLWREFKEAVKEWFNSKVEQVLGLGKAVWNLLIQGGLTVAMIGKMAWEGIKSLIPPTLIRILVEKLVAMIVPAAGAVMVIVEGLRAAWGTVSRILQAFQRFFAFLKAVKSGNAGRKFAQAVAAAAVAVIDFVANWLLLKLAKGASKIGGKLKGIARRLKTKKRRKAAKKKRRADARRGRPGRRRRAPIRPRRRRESAKRRDKKRKDKERKKRERLARAVRAIRPKVTAMLRRGVGKLTLRARLLLWKARYRLKRLRVVPRGGDRVAIVAGNSPDEEVVVGISPEDAPLIRIIREEVDRYFSSRVPEEERGAPWAAGKGTEAKPYDLRAIRGAGTVPAYEAALRQRAVAGELPGLWKREAIIVGERATLGGGPAVGVPSLRQQMFGGLTGGSVQMLGPGGAVERLGAYGDIGERFRQLVKSGLVSPEDLSREIDLMARTGRISAQAKPFEREVASYAHLLGEETVREPAASLFARAPHVEMGRLPPSEAGAIPGVFAGPHTPKGAAAVARGVRAETGVAQQPVGPGGATYQPGGTRAEQEQYVNREIAANRVLGVLKRNPRITLNLNAFRREIIEVLRQLYG